MTIRSGCGMLKRARVGRGCDGWACFFATPLDARVRSTLDCVQPCCRFWPWQPCCRIKGRLQPSILAIHTLRHPVVPQQAASTKRQQGCTQSKALRAPPHQAMGRLLCATDRRNIALQRWHAFSERGKPRTTTANEASRCSGPCACRQHRGESPFSLAIVRKCAMLCL